MARCDAALSHRGEGVNGAVFIAVLAASIPAAESLDQAIEAALEHIPGDSRAAAAVRFGRALVGTDYAVDRLYEEFDGLSPIHTLNNLALVVWALSAADGDFSTAVGDAVAAGWDTDCNGATVGGLFGLTGQPIPAAWTRPWAGRIGTGIAGMGEVRLDDVVERTAAIARSI